MREIGVFGSYARGEQEENSDIDLLVDVNRPMGFIKYMRLENFLSQILETKVDLVIKKKPQTAYRQTDFGRGSLCLRREERETLETI